MSLVLRLTGEYRNPLYPSRQENSQKNQKKATLGKEAVEPAEVIFLAFSRWREKMMKWKQNRSPTTILPIRSLPP